MSGRPQAENAVVFACDQRHLPLAFFAATRIRTVEPEGEFDLAICMPDLTVVPDNLQGRGIRFCQIDVSAIPSVHMPKQWISNAAYYRYLLPSHFLNEYNCLLYLDTDTYLRRAGIGALFASVREPVGLSAAYDTPTYGRISPRGTANFARKLEDLCPGSGRYYNSGVWLSQPAEFARIGGWDRFREAAETCEREHQHYGNTDQDAMNLAFERDIKPLNPLFNWFSRAWLHDREVARYNPYILHFTGPHKPWRPNDDPFAAHFLDEYVTGLQRDFPDFRPDPVADTLPWRRANPKYGFPPADAIANWRYKRRLERKFTVHRDANTHTRFELMDRAIATAEVGRDLD